MSSDTEGPKSKPSKAIMSPRQIASTWYDCLVCNLLATRSNVTTMPSMKEAHSTYLLDK